MVLLKNFIITIAFFLIFNGIYAQQSVSNNELTENTEVTALKKANPKVGKVEQSGSSNNPTWERSKNPNLKETEPALKEEYIITDQKAKAPKK